MPLTIHEIGKVDGEVAFFGIAIRQDSVVGEGPAKGVGDDDNNACRSPIWSVSDVTVQAMEFVDPTARLPGVEGAGGATRFEAHLSVFATVVMEM